MKKIDDFRGAVLLGHPRSGTSLLQRLLGAHAEIAAPPETHLLGACARFLQADITADGVDLGVLAGLHYAGFDEDEVLGRLRELAFGFLDEYTAGQGKARWVEKTAVDVFHLAGIEKLCGEDVLYLGIIRHPLDVAMSCQDFCDAAGVYPAPLHDYVRRYPQPIEAFVRAWIDTTQSLVELGERRSANTILCRYEDLVEDPAEILDALLEPMGLALEPDLIESALRSTPQAGFRDHKGLGEEQVHQRSVGRYARLPQPQVDRLAPLVNPLLEKCGYEPLAEVAPQSARAARRRYAASLAVHARRRGEEAPDEPGS